MATDLQTESRKIRVYEGSTCNKFVQLLVAAILASELIFAHTDKGEVVFVCARTHSGEGVQLHSFLIMAIYGGERTAGKKSSIRF